MNTFIHRRQIVQAKNGNNNNRKSHTPFQLVQKSTTVDDLEWLICTVAEKMRLLEPTTEMLMKVDPYHQWQKCRPMTLVSGSVVARRSPLLKFSMPLYMVE